MGMQTRVPPQRLPRKTIVSVGTHEVTHVKDRLPKHAHLGYAVKRVGQFYIGRMRALIGRQDARDAAL